MSPNRHRMEFEAAIGQLLVIGFDGTEVAGGLRALISNIRPGGVILFARNIVSAVQTHGLLHDCQRLSAVPLLTCVDLEGGKVDRLRSIVGPSPSAADVFATGDRKLFRRHGRIIGENCRALGFNVDLAPVLDLAFEASLQVMGTRVVSQNPRQVVAYAREFLCGLRKAKVLGGGKHFPGLGEGDLDSHRALPAIQKSLRKMWQEDLYPYRALRRELPIVVVSHAAYPLVTGDTTASSGKPEPASLSLKWISGVLRTRIGYRGLIVSDDLEMGGVQSAMSTPEAAVEHIRAGGDIALICQNEEYVVAAYESMVREAERDRRFARRVSESAKRILAFKRRNRQLKILRPPPPQSRMDYLSRQLWELGEQVRLSKIAGQEQQ